MSEEKTKKEICSLNEKKIVSYEKHCSPQEIAH